MIMCANGAETCVRMERSRLCSPIHAQSNFVASVNKTFVLSGGSGGGSLMESICGTVKWVFHMIWNVIATLLHIVGCPVDACSAYISGRYAAIVNYMNAPRSSPPPPEAASGGGREAVGRRLGGGQGGGGRGSSSTSRNGGHVYTALSREEKDTEDKSTSIDV